MTQEKASTEFFEVANSAHLVAFMAIDRAIEHDDGVLDQSMLQATRDALARGHELSAAGADYEITYKTPIPVELAPAMVFGLDIISAELKERKPRFFGGDRRLRRDINVEIRRARQLKSAVGKVASSASLALSE